MPVILVIFPVRKIVSYILFIGFIPCAVWGVTYLTHEQALALAFKKPGVAKRHALIFDAVHRKAIENKLDKPVHQRGVLAYTGALKSNGKQGIVMFDAVIGKHEFIDYMVVLDDEGKVKSIEILAYRESYGGEIRNKDWREQFKDASLKNPPEHEESAVFRRCSRAFCPGLDGLCTFYLTHPSLC